MNDAMRKPIFVVLFSISALAVSLAAQDIRKPVWAGAFYDAERDHLSARIDTYLANVRDLPSPVQDVRAIIAPHAGYIYSGQTAAYAYRLVQGKPYEAVVIIGPSHRHGFDGCSIYLQGGFETPLGVAMVDEALASRLAKASRFSFLPQAHAEEHSIEVQVPFIQTVLPQTKIVPIVMGYPSQRTVDRLANALAEAMAEKNILIVASTDLSHYLSKEEANTVDQRTISLIEKLNAQTIINQAIAGENTMCGGGGVAVAILAAKKTGSPQIKILHYADSSEASGDRDHVVGYLAAAVFDRPPAQEFSLSLEEKKELLALAREAVRFFVEEGKVLEVTTQNPTFRSEKGVFVTLKKRGELRGCIGFVEPLFPLAEAVIRAAVYAASEDPRFLPVSRDELKGLEYEISVLTPLRKIGNPRLVQVGRHGLVVSQGNNKGLLLPQVPIENHWDRETFLNQACLKAGLPPDAWKKGAELFIFEAIVFH